MSQGHTSRESVVRSDAVTVVGGISQSFQPNGPLPSYLATSSNFFHVWNYMDQYVDVEGSSALGQYYVKSIFNADCRGVLITILSYI